MHVRKETNLATAIEKKHHEPRHPSGKHTHEVIREGVINSEMSPKDIVEHLLIGIKNHNFLNTNPRNEVLANSYAQLEQALYLGEKLDTSEIIRYKNHLFSAITDYHA